MSLSWWNLDGAGGDFIDVEAPKITAAVVLGREKINPNNNRSTDALQHGSPSIMFLKAPVVVARKPGEKTGLLPTQPQRPPRQR